MKFSRGKMAMCVGSAMRFPQQAQLNMIHTLPRTLFFSLHRRHRVPSQTMCGLHWQGQMGDAPTIGFISQKSSFDGC